ncbi:MAG: hypothetical protein LBU37_11805 [Tannerellaceae bacterium]|jgi:hypothetical protein|nr:hypothetical protein [Tannerellaceae bacterium]
MKKKKKQKKTDQPKSPRVHRITFMLNNDEHKALLNHFSKYKIENKSRWFREIIFTHVLRTLEEDYPTLFNESEMRG